MSAHEVRCVNKPDPDSPYDEVTHLGDGVNFWWTREEVIAQIEAGISAFFTVEPTTGEHLEIMVIRESGRRPYLKTRAKGAMADHLLALPRCARWHPHVHQKR